MRVGPARPLRVALDVLLELRAGVSQRPAQALFFKAEGAAGEIVWLLDGRELPERGDTAAWPLAPGRHTVSFKAAGARARPVRFTVVE